MKVQVIATGSTHDGVVPGFGVPDTVESPPATYDGWQPRAILGADSPGGLLLPPAMPTASHLYAPRAAWTDGRRVVAADTGNHRVLIWDGVPDTDGVAAAVVLGQSDELLPEDLSETVLESASVPEVPGALQSSVTVIKRQLIVEAWRQSNGDHNQAAARLNIHPNSLRRLIRSLHLRDAL